MNTRRRNYSVSHGPSRNQPPSHSRNNSTPQSRNRSISQGTRRPNHEANFFQGAHGFRIEHQHNTVNQYHEVANPGLTSLMNPIMDASHTRNRKLSPPDSTCLPGTREDVIRMIESWADAGILFKPQHIMWIYGYVGCGKSSLAQTVAEMYARKGRLGASFFFFRGSDSRSSTAKFAATVASQIGAAIPEIIPDLEKAVKTHPGILTTYSLGPQFQHLVYEPLKKFGRRKVFSGSLFRTPYLIVIDGLDECNDHEEVVAFIEHMLQFFKENPRTPLRFLFTSRVEEHIRTRLHESDQVYLFDLIDHTSLDDITAVANATFAAASRHDRVIHSYGDWPSSEDRRRLVEHSGGSLLFMATILKFLLGPNNDGLTPMERLPLVLGISPGLDGLYAEALSRAEGLPHFHEIITALVLFVRPTSIPQFAKTLRIENFEVVRVLVNLHSVIHVPGDDRLPITICHISFRDFLQSEDRAGRFFIPPDWHDRIYSLALAGCERGSLSAKVVATIALSLEPLSINMIAALLGCQPPEIAMALDSVGPLFSAPPDYDDLITPCDSSLLTFLHTESRSGSAYVSQLHHEALAYGCFEIIARPSYKAAVRYAKSHAMSHWQNFLDTIRLDVARLRNQVNITLVRLREIFPSEEMGLVDVVLTIVFTLSIAPVEVTSTLSVQDFLYQCLLPGKPEHAMIIQQVLSSFIQLGGGYRSLPDIQPDIVDYLSLKALWNPSPPEQQAIVYAHMRLLLTLMEEDIRFKTSDNLASKRYRESLERRAEASPLFVSEFTRFVMEQKVKLEKDKGGGPMVLDLTRSALKTDAVLDNLYARILGHADRAVPFLESFLSATTLAKQCFTLKQLSQFLHVEPGEIRSLSERLRGLVDPIVPCNLSRVTLQAPFSQYLRSRTRAGRFFAASPSSSRTMAISCLQLLAENRLASYLGLLRQPHSLYDYACQHCSTHWKESLVDLSIDHETRQNELVIAITLLGRHCSSHALRTLLEAYLHKSHAVFHDVANGSRSGAIPQTSEEHESWALENDFAISAKVLDVLEQHFRSLGPLLTPEEMDEGPIAEALSACTENSGSTSLTNNNLLHSPSHRTHINHSTSSPRPVTELMQTLSHAFHADR